MILEKKIKILSWTLIFVLLMNITAISTIIYRHREHMKMLKKNECLTPKYQQEHIGERKEVYKKYLIEELNLSEQQQIQYDNIKTDFHSKTHSFFDSIHYYNTLIDSQLINDEADRLLIEKYSTRIGNLHKQLKIEYIYYNFNIKNILNQNQKVKYFDAFKKFKSQHFYKNKNDKKQKRQK